MPDDLLHTLEIEPAEGEPDASVIWLHGLGATCHDFEPIVPELGLPADARIRFVFPQAPQQPVTLNWGMEMPAWYDIKGLDDSRDADEPGIRRSAGRVKALVDRERERGIAAGRIVLAGFSQGGAMALHVGLRYDEKLAGIMVLSAYLLLAAKTQTELADANRQTPILQCHGSYDPMVKEHWGQKTHDALVAAGFPAEYHTYPMQHEVCLPEIERIGEWLHQRLPPS